MIPLPPGCTVTYSVYIDVDQLTDEMIDWYKLIGGKVWDDEWYDYRGRLKKVHYVQYGKGKRCHLFKDGTNGARLHFHGDDAPTASVFIIKFFDRVTNNNLQEQMERISRETA